jgi:PAS domain S-box-containing protein
MIQQVHKIQSKVVNAIIIITLVISGLVMLAWMTNFKPLLELIPGKSTMKFNTAFCFLFTGLGLYFSINRKRFNKVYNYCCALILIFFGAVSFSSYFPGGYTGLNQFFISDPYSLNNPGAMSQATAMCFTFVGIALLGIHAKYKLIKKAMQALLLITLLTSLISVVSYLLQIPNDSQVDFLGTMAIHTSFLFIILSFAIALKNYDIGFTALMLGRKSGSKLLRMLLPFVILVPLVFSYILLYITHKDLSNLDFNIVIYTVTFILVSVAYIVSITTGLNKADKKRRELENSLRETNQELVHIKSALDQSSIVAITDARGVITSVNDKFCEISEFSREELVGKTHRLVNSKYHNKEFFKNLWGTIQAGKVWIGEIKNKTKTGNYYWVHTAIIPFINEQGEIYQHFTIRQDITQRKLLSQEYTSLKEKNKEIEQFAYIASHDLQEPIRTVQNMVSFLESTQMDALDNQAKKSLTFISEATSRMNELIYGLLEFSRIGREKQLSTVDCNLVINNIKQDLALAIEKKHAIITYTNLPSIRAYNTELRMLFQNLITNALKFTAEGVQPEIFIDAKKELGSWVFSIKDNGIGIATEHKKKVFAIFQRLNARKAYEGTGIGLAHCEKIVHLHGGEIWLESKPGEGSTFYFSIPIIIS